MPLTPETLPRHELNGLCVRVVDSDDTGLVGIEGRVVVETMQTLHVEDRRDTEPRVRQVPKQGTTFEFAITDEAADRRACDTSTPVTGGDGVREGSGTASEPGRYQDGTAGEGVAYVTVDGARLLARPAERTETTGDSPWR